MTVLTRKIFLRACAVGFAALIAGAACANGNTGSQQKNVLLIYVDDLRPEINLYDKAMPKGNTVQLPGTGRHELYDYQTDPAGNENIAVNPRNRELLDKLIEQMDAGWKAARPSAL